MNKGLKYGLLIFGIAIIALVGLIGYGLSLMEIEDQYGDYQNIYYKSKDSDILVNEETSEFGIAGKNWKRLNVWTKEKDSTDLYTFASKASYYSKIKVYRPKTEIERIKQIDFSDIQELIANNKFELILEHQNE
ncbi:hypothetical protein LNI98_11685 [Tenacibaculum dicentrarchi]|nr:hypothetical protein [Tenacibaculum dicentrarchi]WBX67889.1 hypothetical protein PG910_07060 [Tenacibaculum dicentrarchi]